MTPLDVIILLVGLSIIAYVVGNNIYRKSKKLPTGECYSCSLKAEKTLKEIRKELRKAKCCCNK